MTKGNVMNNVTSSQLEASFNAPEDWKPVFSPWRHGGWYVNNTRYPNGGCGCVSNNYPDKKWRIACDERRGELGEPGDFTFPSRAAAARAEYAYVKSLEHGLTLLPQQVAFEVFKRKSVLTPLENHGRVASVFFNGHDCGFVDAVGIDGRKQAHRSEVNNALYANSPDAPAFLARPLPSRSALADYPDLEELFPDAAAMVRATVGNELKGEQ